MTRMGTQTTVQQWSEERDNKILLCNEVRGELKKFDHWVSELDKKVKNIPSAMAAATSRNNYLIK